MHCAMVAIWPFYRGFVTMLGYLAYCFQGLKMTE